jgi:hypothetical protein
MQVKMRKPDLERKRDLSGIQRIYRFKNGYGASVVRGFGTYGNEAGKWELAVIIFKSDDIIPFDLCYTTPITNNVIGWLSESQVNKILKKIERLK